jgi:hypothetical protein
VVVVPDCRWRPVCSSDMVDVAVGGAMGCGVCEYVQLWSILWCSVAR